MNSSWDNIISVVVEHLPDSITERHRVLESLLEVCPKGHPAIARVRDLHGALVSHQLAQREFNLDADTRGGSRLGDNPVERSTSSRRGR